MQARTQLGLVETIEFTYLDTRTGWTRSVTTPFETEDGCVHIRLAIDGVPYAPFVMRKDGLWGWNWMKENAPDVDSLLMSLVPYAQPMTDLARDPDAVRKQWSEPPASSRVMEEAMAVWGDLRLPQ